MADTFEPIFDPVIYTAMRLVYEDNPTSSKELKDMVLNALHSRNLTPLPGEDSSSSRPSSSRSTGAIAKEEVVELKEDFDDIPTSSISIGRKSGSGAVSFTDGCCICGKTKHDSPGHKLFECTECHRIYHQNCHSPPIRDKPDCKVDDPRFVFYCCDCAPAAAPETTLTNRPSSTVRTASSTNITAGWTVNRSAQQQPAPISTTKETAPSKVAKRRLPSEDD